MRFIADENIPLRVIDSLREDRYYTCNLYKVWVKR